MCQGKFSINNQSCFSLFSLFKDFNHLHVFAFMLISELSTVLSAEVWTSLKYELVTWCHVELLCRTCVSFSFLQLVMQRGKFIVCVLPCYKHVRCDNVIFSFQVLLCWHEFCSHWQARFFIADSYRKTQFNPAHLLIVSYPLKWQSTPGCQPLRPNP